MESRGSTCLNKYNTSRVLSDFLCYQGDFPSRNPGSASRSAGQCRTWVLALPLSYHCPVTDLLATLITAITILGGLGGCALAWGQDLQDALAKKRRALEAWRNADIAARKGLTL